MTAAPGNSSKPSLAVRSNLFLIGYRGTGKSTIGQRLARVLQWTAVDADELLEKRAGRSIAQIFRDAGEQSFRDQESALLEELCGACRQVVATGGGIVLRSHNRALLRQAGTCVLLTARPATLWQRIQADQATWERRPNLTIGGLAEIEQLLAQREPLYRECADLIVPTDGRSPDEIVAAIQSQITLD